MDIRHIIKLDKLIKSERTGKPSELALNMELSERTIFNYLEFMRTHLNAPIKWNRYKNTYYYELSGQFNFEWRSN